MKSTSLEGEGRKSLAKNLEKEKKKKKICDGGFKWLHITEGFNDSRASSGR